MRKLTLIILLLSCTFPLMAQESGGGEDAEWCNSLIQAARNYCNQSYYTCRVSRGTCPVACVPGTDPVCDDQYTYCMDSVVPWYCGSWAN